MSQAENFIFSFEGEQGAILRYFHHLLAEELALTPKIRYQIPFYYRHSWICYLNPTKNGGVELAFPRGNELSNVQGLLEAKGRKQVAGITFEKRAGIPEDAVREILLEALILDEEVRYGAKRKRGS